MTLGEQIRSFRQRRGLTQQALADAAGVQKAAIGRIEAGIRKPGPDLLERICEALGVELRLISAGKAARKAS